MRFSGSWRWIGNVRLCTRLRTTAARIGCWKAIIDGVKITGWSRWTIVGS